MSNQIQEIGVGRSTALAARADALLNSARLEVAQYRTSSLGSLSMTVY